MVGKIFGEQRSVVVTEVRTKPGKPTNGPATFHSEWQDEQNGSVRRMSNNDRRLCPAPCPNVALPLGEPRIGLEHGSVGGFFELSPFLLDLGQLAIHSQFDTRRGC